MRWQCEPCSYVFTSDAVDMGILVGMGMDKMENPDFTNFKHF